MTTQTLSFDVFDDLAQQMIHLAFEHSTDIGEPVGAVFGGVLHHLALEAMLNNVPQELLLAVIITAGDAYKDLERMALDEESAQ